MHGQNHIKSESQVTQSFDGEISTDEL